MTDVSKIDYFNKPHLEQLVKEVLHEASVQGATSAEVYASVNKGFTATVRMGDVETVEYNQDKIIEITVYFGKRSGSASISDVRPEAIRSAVEAACNIARFTDEDPYGGLAEKELLAVNCPDLDIYYPWDISVPHAIELAKECESLSLMKDKRIENSEGVTISTGEVWNAYGNSHGFIGITPATRHEICSILIAKHGKEMQRDYAYTVACEASMLDSIKTIADKAVERTVSRLGGRKLGTRHVPVIFAAEEARGLLGHFVSATQGGNIFRKSSYLVDHIGKQIFPSFIKIDERPHLPKYLGSAAFDDDGLETRPNVFVEDGILKQYATGIYSARKLKTKPTGNAGGVHNLFITTSDKDLKGLMKQMDKGLLITELMGNGVNIVTGDYSRGVGGFWVENGEIQYPVEEMTVAGKLQDMYGNLVAVGNDVDKRGNIQTGSILLEEMTIGGE